MTDYNEAVWRVRYIKQLIKRGVEKEFAEETYDAGYGFYDLTDNPEDSADDELSYWID